MAILLAGVTAEEYTCVAHSCLHWFANFGIPLHFTSDCWIQFISTFWSHLAVTLGTTLHCTTSYHTQSNRLMHMEHFHCSLKIALQVSLANPDWYDHLVWTLLALHTALKEDLNMSPAGLACRHLPLLVRTLVTYPSCAPSCAPSHHTAATPVDTGVPATVSTASLFVFLYPNGHHPPTPPVPKYRGPYQVLHAGDNIKTFTVDIGGRAETASINSKLHIWNHPRMIAPLPQ